MKLIKTMLAVGAFALMSSTPLMTAQAQQGVKCDDQKQMCRDRSGPNAELTRQRYGDQAAQKVERRLSKGENGGGKRDDGQRGGGQRDNGQRGGGQRGGDGQNGNRQSEDVFSPAGGVRCVRSEQTCYHHNQPSYPFTRQHFGPSAASRLNR